MKVVLLKPRKGLGNIGDVVEVKDGFGRNFLIPQKIATRATEQNLKAFEERKKDLEVKNAEFLKDAKAAAEKISGKDYTFVSQSSDDGRLFGSVSAKDVANVLVSQVPFIHASNVILEHPIKMLGIFEVTIHLHAEVDTKVLINVSRTETEAKDALVAYKAQNSAEAAA